jgi:hypothetical protein
MPGKKGVTAKPSPGSTAPRDEVPAPAPKNELDIDVTAADEGYGGEPPALPSEQIILTVKRLAEWINETYNDGISIKPAGADIYYFSGKVKLYGNSGYFSSKSTTYFTPYAIRLRDASKKPCGMIYRSELLEAHGELFGVIYSDSKNRKLYRDTVNDDRSICEIV